ncbi:hypothetical protein D4M88_25170 [Enterobacter roggenkampii]|nr:hypothetical protein D4M93_25455 [Enterobacter roggenkampii]TXU82991.1 hypothetical protein D4M95_25475 [Enterobacter roggenkampii]TXU93327.1 hypothetical protein D4M88_25170 [Enterobacter roggenkampii]
MGSCAAPSAKGDDKFITTDYLQQCLWKYRGQSTKVFFVNSGINQHRLMFLVLCEFTVCSLIRNSL